MKSKRRRKTMKKMRIMMRLMRQRRKKNKIQLRSSQVVVKIRSSLRNHWTLLN